MSFKVRSVTASCASFALLSSLKVATGEKELVCPRFFVSNRRIYDSATVVKLVVKFIC